MPSERKPSTDQVLTKTSIGFGFRARWVSRSAMWMPLTPRSRISRAQPSRSSGPGSVKAWPVSRARSSSACLTNHDTMPGLAPQQEIAVEPPGFFAFSSRTVFAERIVGALLRTRALVEIEARPRLDDGVDVERAELAAEPHDVERRGVDREVDAEAPPAARGQERGQEVAIVLPRHRLLDEADAPLVEQPPVAVVGIDHHEAGAVEIEVALDQRQHAFADRAEADHDDRSVDPAVNGPVRHCMPRIGNGSKNSSAFNAGSRAAGQPEPGCRDACCSCRNRLPQYLAQERDTGRLFFLDRSHDTMTTRIRLRTAVLFALVLPLGAGAASAQASLRSGNAVFDRAVDIVLANFYRPSELDQFRDAVSLTVESFPELAKAEPALVDDAIDFVLQSLQTSHTARYPKGSVEYYELLDVFRFAARDAVRRLYPPEGNITYDGIGMATRSIDGAIFVTDVYDGGPADKAGVLPGDEILWVDGKPFTGTEAFRGRTAASSVLTARRERYADPITLTVPVERLEPSESLVEATADSAEIVERDGYRIGYLRIWAYTERDMKATIEEAIAGPLAEADALVLDLRCRWGGAPADAADTFIGGAPDMTMIFRNGERDLVHARWRKPMVAIIDEGTRSGMEIFAHALKANGVKLIGAPTAGDVVAGRGYVLPDDSLLILAVADVYVDGMRLEGVGVTPDVAVPFDVRYAAGRDPQRDAAFEEMVKSLAAEGAEVQ